MQEEWKGANRPLPLSSDRKKGKQKFAGNTAMALVYRGARVINHAWIAAMPKRMELAT